MILLAFWILPPPFASAAQIPTTAIKWVNAETGSNANNGTYRLPWRTVSHALCRASDPQSAIAQINVMWTATPIAPGTAAPIDRSTYMCPPFTPGTCEPPPPPLTEPINWGDPAHPGQEPCNAFPLKLVPGVVVAGVQGPGGKLPRLAIYETFDLNPLPNIEDYASYPWPHGEPKAYVLGADGAVLSNFELDGSFLRTKPQHEPVGVHCENPDNFQIIACTIKDMFDGVRFVRTLGAGVSTAIVRDTFITGCFPGFAPDPAPSDLGLKHDRGHSALWLEIAGSGDAPGEQGVPPAVPSRLEVDAINCIFENGHDAVETKAYAFTHDTEILFRTTACAYRCNESGIEIVSDFGAVRDRCRIEVRGCTFYNHWNRRSCEGGYQGAVASACLLGRIKAFDLFVRDSIFVDNAVVAAIVGAGNEVDFGKPGDPGNNVFWLNLTSGGNLVVPPPTPASPPNAANPQPDTVVVLKLGAPGYEPPLSVSAYGNRWIPSNQGADQHGRMTPGGQPSGCAANSACDLQNDALWDAAHILTQPRNFSIWGTPCEIDFGPAGSVMSCSPTANPPCGSALLPVPCTSSAISGCTPTIP
ncbi:MAG: hypothetical protein ACKVWV_07330 [Planctomycetota bacterium]